MNIEEAKSNIGQLVMSCDPGDKAVLYLSPHGPYKLLKVTDDETVVLEGREEYRVPAALISLYDNYIKARIENRTVIVVFDGPVPFNSFSRLQLRINDAKILKEKLEEILGTL